MTHEEITRMAREAGAYYAAIDEETGQEFLALTEDAFERFAALVAAAEREECAKLIEDKFDFCGDELIAAEAIRARGNNEQ